MLIVHNKVSREVFFLRYESLKVIFVQYHDLTTYRRTLVMQRGLINFTRSDLWGDGVLPASSSLPWRRHLKGSDVGGFKFHQL